MELEISVEDLLNKRKIESDRIEFKAGWNPDDIYHSVCAFANDYNNDGGGYIVVGVEEKNGVAVRPVKGISEYMLDEIQKEMLSYNNMISPPYFPKVIPLEVDGKWILVIVARTGQQRHYEKLKEYLSKLNEYVEKIQICGDGRNSYSKTDHSATFMRIKKDYMGNDQLLPAYNVQVGVADEYIAVVDVNQYRSDMDCFIPLMNKFHDIYGFYPKYPVADAGYGSYNNYIFCEQNGLEKYMKFPMFKKETTDKNYHEDPFRAVNFKIDGDGKMRCPNGKGFHLQYRKAIKGNAYGREEEIYQCEDCSGCPYAEKCKKGEGNRTVRVNQELTKMHQEVIQNLESIQGALLRMNRSIQAEGTFGIIKNDRWYKRIVRRGIKSVQLEVYLVSLGHNLYKFHNKQMKIKSVA